jgi:hypothetical protein
MVRICNKNGEMRNVHRILVSELKGREHLQDLDIDDR